MEPDVKRVMERRPFGQTGMTISRIGLGTWAIGGGGWAFGWGPQDDEQSAEAIRRALSLRIDWIDTAPVYGTGHSEEVVGATLQGTPEHPHVFTKVSLVWDKNRKVRSSLKAASIRQEVDASLSRLQTDAIDLSQVHWPAPEKDIEEGWRTLAELKDEGKVRHIGVSNFSVEQMERAAAIAPVETLQTPYSLIHPEVEEEILPYARAHGIGVIVYSPMACGLLSGSMTVERVKGLAKDDWRRKDPEFKGKKLARNLALAALLTEMGRDHRATAAEVAIAWTLGNPAVTAAIVGARSASQVDGFIGASKVHLDVHEIDRLSSFP